MKYENYVGFIRIAKNLIVKKCDTGFQPVFLRPEKARMAVSLYKTMSLSNLLGNDLKTTIPLTYSI